MKLDLHVPHLAPFLSQLVRPVRVHGPWPPLLCRHLAQAAFTPRAIRGYLPRMQATAEEAVAQWAAQGTIL